MNFLFLNWRDRKNPLSGGAEVVTENIILNLVERGHKVTLFTAKFEGCQQEESPKKGYKIIRSGTPYTVHLKAYKWWKKEGRNLGFDVVIDQIHGLPFFTPFYIERTKKVAFIHEVSRLLWFKIASFPLALIFYLLEPLVFFIYRKTAFITVSNSTKEELSRFFVPKRNIAVIHQAINIAPLALLPRKEIKPTLLFAGRIHPMKRVDHLIKMMRYLPEKYSLTIIGSGEENYVNRLKNLAKKIAGNRIKFTGFVDSKERNRLMQEAGLVVSASYKEGWGLIVTEANALGTIAVTYNVAGYRDSIEDGKTGVLAKENTPEGLARTVIEVLADKESYEKMRQLAWQKAKERTYARATDDFLKVI